MYTDIHMDGDDYILIREQDVIAIMPRKSEYGVHGAELGAFLLITNHR
jgi:hypothetical protein